MRVDDAPRESREGLRTDALHVAGQDHQLGPAIDQHLADGGVQRRGVGMSLTREMVRGHTGPARPLEGPRLSVVADDRDHAAGNRPRRARVQDGLQRRPFVRGEHREPHARLR